MTIIYSKQTGKVLFNRSKPLDYSKNEPVYNVTTDPETGEESRELLGYTMYYDPEFFATAEVSTSFREHTYNP